VNDCGTPRLALVTTAVHGAQGVTTAVVAETPGGLPALSEAPPWEECVRLRKIVQYHDESQRALAVFPIEATREIGGILVIKGAITLQNRDIGLVSALLRIVRNHVELLDYGERDTLTRMLNRKTFESRFMKLRQRLRATDSADSPDACWIGLADIDKFKSINDCYGHLFGDEVLLLVSQLMQECFRGADQLFRFGGEEFVIVLDNATVAGAEKAFDRLRVAIAAFQFPQVGHVTISLGYSRIWPDDGPTTCVERADAALYYAKQNGRNRICNFEGLLAAGELRAKSVGDEAELF
jgi:diguanylate cyclase (GGDEF)-like protein